MKRYPVDKSCVPKRRMTSQLFTVCYWAQVCKEKARVIRFRHNVVLFWVCFVFVRECHSSFECLKRSMKSIFSSKGSVTLTKRQRGPQSLLLTDFVFGHVVVLNHVTWHFQGEKMCVLSLLICNMYNCSCAKLNCSNCFPARLILRWG